jgi:hypothetical protein
MRKPRQWKVKLMQIAANHSLSLIHSNILPKLFTTLDAAVDDDKFASE